MRRFSSGWLLPLVFPICAVVHGQECSRSLYSKLTDDFYFSASSDQGAQGDVVAVDISLSIENLHPGLGAIDMVACYDANLAEFLDPPAYSDFFESVAPFINFWHLGGEFGPQRPGGGHGLELIADVYKDRISDALLSTQTLPIMTLFFRLKGAPGNAFPLDFCDATFVGIQGSCEDNNLYYIRREGVPVDTIALSTRHIPGQVRILPGAPTHPDRPPAPPQAKVYPEPPTPETAQLHFELTGAVARPGDQDVPMEVYITSTHEFSGFHVSLVFPVLALEDYLDLWQVEEHTRPGAVSIFGQNDLTLGHVGIAMQNSRRRVGAEGERVKVATLHFKIKEGASAVSEIAPHFEDYRGFQNLVAINYTNGVSTTPLPLVAEVAPLVISNGLLKIQNRPTRPGDVNLDYDVNLTDAITILSELFLGTQDVLCPEAADFNKSGTVNISDPIGILNYLFLGTTVSLTNDVYCSE